MDQTIVDVTDVPGVTRGDEVVSGRTARGGEITISEFSAGPTLFHGKYCAR